jgi:hypothetical protein
MCKIKDRTGERFGNLVVICFAGKDKYNKAKWHCRCDCGNEVDVLASSLVAGRTESCGCLQKKRTSECSFRDLSGKTFGELFVLSRTTNDKFGKVHYLCKCSCGKEVVVVGERMVSGNTLSCGHLSGEKHGMVGTRFYQTWKNMIQRCSNANNKSYKYYGARGIKVCDRWKNSFLAFKEDMYDSYLKHCEDFGKKETTVDRIDSTKDYCKENCRWATWKEQYENRRKW